MNIKEIIVNELINNQLDGLYNEMLECCCFIENIGDCLHFEHNCRMGSRYYSEEIGDYIDKPKKNKLVKYKGKRDSKGFYLCF